MEIQTTPKKKLLLEKRGIYMKEDLLDFLPRKYHDFTTKYRQVNPLMNGMCGCFIGIANDFKKKNTANECSCITFKLKMDAGRPVKICLFGQAFMWKMLKEKNGKELAVCGTLTYTNPYGFSIADPKHIVDAYKADSVCKIETEYSHISGISQEYMVSLIDDAISCCEEMPIDDDLLRKYKIASLPGTKEAYQTLHHPKSMNMDKARQRIVVNKMLKFLIEMEHQNRNYAKGTQVIIKSTKVVRDIIKNLPYSLTDDQNKYLVQMTDSIRNGKRVSALLQGDVGCGKTMIAVLMLFLMAENGYQGELMAPTAILAKQHYEEIKKYADMYGIETAYIDGTVSAGSKKKIMAGIESGKISIVVGTQALAFGNIKFHNLGMAIIDEEHRFGVEQRNAILDNAAYGVNTLLMSATPIPRTLANSIHGNTEIMDIHTMPSNRKPVQTAICNSDNTIFKFLDQQLAEGRQAYVVCPLIEKTDEDGLMKDVLSVNDTYDIYKKHYGEFYQVAMLNGKMSEKEISDTIQKFKDGNIHVLISTTVIEVGVNVPNASVIVISNAERFGLAAMHQLRGRVGRGQYKSYCILKSADRENERLKTMVDCADGFTIAEKDLSLRGAGNLIGLKQSGNSKLMDLVLQYPNMYEIIKNLAGEIVDRE